LIALLRLEGQVPIARIIQYPCPKDMELH
jgi:hypothetical protein